MVETNEMLRVAFPPEPGFHFPRLPLDLRAAVGARLFAVAIASPSGTPARSIALAIEAALVAVAPFSL